MFAERKVVIVVAVVLVISGFLFWHATSDAPSTNTTLTPSLSVTASTTTPVVNQSFTLSGTLKAGSTPLSGKTIRLQREDPSGNWVQAVNTTTTDANGAYTLTVSESAQGTYRFEPTFIGATYASANATVSITVGNVLETEISILTTNSNPAVNQSFTVHGILQNGVSGAPLAGQPITLANIAPSGAKVTMNTITDANGSYSFTVSDSAQGSYIEQANFYGTASYLATSSMLFVTVGNPIPTSLSLNVTNSNPAVNQSFTISGYLTDINGTKLPNKALWVNILLPTGQWNMTQYTATDSNGYFSATYSEQVAGQYRFEFHFMGDSIYAHCGPAIEVAVGTLEPTNISMNTSVTNPAVNQSFTLSGTLTDANGTPLAGREVLLSQSPGDGGYVDQRYTDQNGSYSFVLNDSAIGNYQYTAIFLGDQTDAHSLASVGITVGT